MVFGYNQIYVWPEDQENTTFTTPWGTFMYAKMSFGLMNARATFQHAMDFVFIREKDKFLVIYLDGITIFSASDQEHLQHLRQVFVKCRKYVIFLNPKKSHFSLKEGKMPGHIVSKNEVRIDPKRVIVIQDLNLQDPRKRFNISLVRTIFSEDSS